MKSQQSDNLGKNTKKTDIKRSTWERFYRIRHLTCYDELEFRLLSGERVKDIAGWIEELEQWKEAKYKSKVRELFAFKKWLVTEKPGRLPELSPKYIQEAVDILKESNNYIDVIKEEVWSLRKQKQRLKKSFETEQKLPIVILDAVRKEMDQYMRMLEQYRRTLQDLGAFPIKAPAPIITQQNAYLISESLAKKAGEIRKLPGPKRMEVYEAEFVELLKREDEG